MSKKEPKNKEKSKDAVKKRRLTVREKSVLATASAEEATMTAEQCLIWQTSDVRMRIRAAIAQWAGVSPTVITSALRLRDIAPPADGPWSMIQQVNLIAITNNQNPPIFHSIIPEDDQCEMRAPNSLISGDTTVLEWEDVVWRNQNPGTFCGRTFGI